MENAPQCQQGPPVSTSWTKLSLCWAFSRNPETLLLCFCPCHGQSGPSPASPLLPCAPRSGCHSPAHPSLTGWGLTLWHSQDAASTWIPPAGFSTSGMENYSAPSSGDSSSLRPGNPLRPAAGNPVAAERPGQPWLQQQRLGTPWSQPWVGSDHGTP